MQMTRTAFTSPLQHPKMRPLVQAARAHLRFALRGALGRRRHGLPARLVVSLTSYPKRFSFLQTTLKSLLSQETRPDLVVLWIYKGDAALLPKNVLKLRKKGLAIRLVDSDTRSFKKLVPAAAEYRDSYIVTADDDTVYPRDWLTSLVSAVDPDRREVLGLRGRLIEVRADGSFTPYSSWELLEEEVPASDRILLTGVGGILYPPHCFDYDVLSDASRFLDLCPTADDLWFYFLLRRNGYVFRKVGDWIPVEPVENSQDTSLWELNEEGENDRSWHRLVREFGNPLREQSPHIS
jgi:hypothetical protein